MCRRLILFCIYRADYLVHGLPRHEAGEEGQKRIARADGVYRAHLFLHGDIGNKFSCDCGIHAGLLVMLHAGNRAPDASAVDIVAVDRLFARLCKARFYIARLNRADGDTGEARLQEPWYMNLSPLSLRNNRSGTESESARRRS